MFEVPRELAFGGVYFPPMLLNGSLGVVAAVLTAVLLNRYRVSRFFANPPLVLVALSVIYASLLSIFVIPA